MILLIILNLLAMTIVTWSSPSTTVPVIEILQYAPDIVGYSVAGGMFDHGSRKFDSIVGKDHFVDHQLRKDHPERTKRKDKKYYSWARDGRESGPFEWTLKEVKAVAESKLAVLLVVLVFLLFLYWRGRQRKQTSVRLAQVEEELSETIERREE